MTEQQAVSLVATMAAAFPQRPVGEDTVELYTRMLQKMEYATASVAIQDLLLELDWLPSLAQINKRAAKYRQNVIGPSEAFEELWRAIGRYGSYKTPQFSSPLLSEAVSRLGGWIQICSTWKTDQQTWHRKEFMAEYQSLAERSATDPQFLERLKTKDYPQLAGRHDRAPMGANRGMLGDVLRKALEGISGNQGQDTGEEDARGSEQDGERVQGVEDEPRRGGGNHVRVSQVQGGG